MAANRALPARIDTVIVGAGQAGLSMSWWLTQAGVDHVLLEARDRLGGSWLKRWDTFCLVTPNWGCRMPGFPYDGPDPDGYMPRDAIVDYFGRYADSFGAPVVFDSAVTRLHRIDGGSGSGIDGGSGFRLETAQGPVEASTVIVASGAFQVPRIPPLGAGLPPEVLQLHSDGYRNERDLPPGAVLVVGSGQSGAQIAEELHEAGRHVFLSVGSCGRIPRRYRGRDVFWWIAHRILQGTELGLHVRTVDDLPNPSLRFACNPHVSGKNGGHDIDLRRLGASGVTLLGHLETADGGHIRMAPDLAESLRVADTFFDERFRPEFDEFIVAAGIDAPPDDRTPFVFEPPSVPDLDLAKAGISTVIWATGYRPDFRWISLPIFDEYGYPWHVRGESEAPGLYFLGLPWLYTMASSTLAGVGDDARYISERVRPRLT